MPRLSASFPSGSVPATVPGGLGEAQRGQAFPVSGPLSLLSVVGGAKWLQRTPGPGLQDSGGLRLLLSPASLDPLNWTLLVLDLLESLSLVGQTLPKCPPP